jgi:hypothetical protein
VPNTTTNVIPQLLAQGLLALRQNAIMPRLVNRGYEEIAGEKGSTIDIPIPSAIAAQAVAPGNTPPSTADVSPTKVSLQLNKWYEAPFYLTDKDMLEVMNGTIPMQASEAIKALVNQVEADIFSAIELGVFGYAGVAGATPFATDLSEWTAARTVLSKQLAPMGEKRVVLNTDAVGNAILLRAFQDTNFGAGAEQLAMGQFARKLGAAWFEDQNVPSHTAGTGTGYLVNNGAGYPAGTKTITTDTGSGTVLAGDIVVLSGVTGTYKVASSVGGASVTSIVLVNGLAGAVLDNATITIKASHVLNVAFHPDCIAFGSRPFAGADPMGIGHYMSAVDPISGLTLRLEVSREHKRTRFSYDMLYGVQCVRPELGSIIAG